MNLIYEFPSLDPENTTGRLGFYELAGAYYLSYDATTKNEDPEIGRASCRERV